MKKKRRSYIGNNNPNYRHGKYTGIHYCIEKGCKTKVCSEGRRCKYHKGLEQSKRMLGKNNPNYRNPLNMKGKNHPRYKDGNFLIKHLCLDCGKEIHPYAKYCYVHANIGKRNPNYYNGKYNEPYSIDFNNELRKSIRERDHYTCQKCKIKEKDYKRTLDVHHIDYNKKNSRKDNLITLCNECNNQVNKDRKHWEEYFKNLINKKENK